MFIVYIYSSQHTHTLHLSPFIFLSLSSSHTHTHTHTHLQVSCIASSPAFRNRKLFPRYFQLLPTDASLAITYLGLIEFYNWKRVAIIVQMENLFTVVHNVYVCAVCISVCVCMYVCSMYVCMYVCMYVWYI